MSIKWGARIDGEVYGRGDAPWDATTWNTYEQHTGKKVSLLHWGQPFGQLDLNACNLVRNRGATSLISIGVEGTTLSNIAAGGQDAKLTDFARKCYQYGGELLLRFAWEMNGTWYSWGRNSYYINAWRRFYTIVRGTAPNVKMVWCPNTVWDTASGELSKWYPGDAYVDFLGMDGYNKNTPWQSPSQVFDYTLKRLISLNTTSALPVMICETGCTEKGGNKSQWIRNFLTEWLPAHRRVQAFAWFNWNISEGGIKRDWQIESSPAAQEAFRKGIANEYYH